MKKKKMKKKMVHNNVCAHSDYIMNETEKELGDTWTLLCNLVEMKSPSLH